MQKKKSQNSLVMGLFTGLGERIRTSGLLNPIQARYQAAPHPDESCEYYSNNQSARCQSKYTAVI